MKITSTRNFSSIFVFLVISLCLVSCKNNQERQTEDEIAAAEKAAQEPFFDLSLAQWSLHRQLYSGELDPMDFAEKASKMGFTGIEYVNIFYAKGINEADDKEAAMQELVDSLNAKSEEHNVENVLIMIDGEGDLAAANEEERNTAVENHKKWVDAAAGLGCHSIRVNLFGSNEPGEWKKSATDGLTKLSEYAAEKDINVLVENHGHFSSNAELLVDVMEEVSLPNCGTLPDFGNFCIRREGGERWEAKCVEEYPKYKGVEEMMPYAKAVSAKSYDFDEEGNETTIDYERMLKIVKDAGYTGFVGVEYEGDKLSEEEGIIATKKLLKRIGSELNKEQP